MSNRNEILHAARAAWSGARRSAAAVLAVAALIAASGPAQAAAMDPKYDPSKLATPPLHPIQKITPERIVLKNGIVAYLLENHDLPVVRGVAYARSTPLWIPDDKVGLGEVVGSAMRSGGTAAHSGDWLDDRLAAIGASITSGQSVDFATSGFRCLTENTDEVLGLWAEDMPEDKIELAKVGLRRQIASRNDELTSVIQRVAIQAVFGKGSPWARWPEYATVEAVSRDDCVKLHQKLFEPSRMVVAIYGDFSAEDMKKSLAAKLGAWQGPGVPFPAQPPMPGEGKPRLVFAPKEDVTQSGILVAHLGFRADDPDYPAMDVYQMALGGGFQSRLINEIRTKRGLAYTTGARAGEGYVRPGVFVAYTLTRSDSTLKALDLLREEVKKSVDAPFTAEELTTAKNSVENTFVFNFEEPSSILFRAAYYEVVGYPQDFLQKYQQGLHQVTGQMVLDAARRKVHPDQMVAVVVGKEKDFDRKLETSGLPVERVNISIPPPPSKVQAAPATAQSLSKGQEWLKKAIDLTGGSAAWKGIKTARIEQEATISMQGQSFQLTMSMSVILPDRMLVVQHTPMGEMKSGFDGQSGWMLAGGKSQDDPKAAKRVKEEWERSFFHLFGSPDEVQIQAADQPKTIEGVAYNVAYVKSDLVRDWTLYFAPDGWLSRMEFQGEGPTGPGTETEIYSDWKQVGKVQFPHAQKTLLNGEPFVDSKVSMALLGAPLDEALFKKPAQ
jgi:zinc protease